MMQCCSAFINLIVFGILWCNFVVTGRQTAFYQNQFAVHIPSGKGDADEIAARHGFVNLGKIGSLNGFYLFEHHSIRKRSVDISVDHHEKLGNETKVSQMTDPFISSQFPFQNWPNFASGPAPATVLWFQQQHEKKRRKRDYIEPNFSNFGGFSFYTPSSGGYHPQFPPHFQAYRGIGPHNLFPDPLFKEQWYLNGGAKDGYDMNVGPAWQKGYTGKGVVISILDDGIQTNHPDLALNYHRGASTDINDNDDDPMPRDNGDNKHGTRCAGEVAAVAFNDYCGIGVAYNASIGGVRMLDGTVNDAVEARALGLNPDIIDIYSASWGPEDDGKTVDGPGPLARRAFIYGVTNGRKGKGSIFVWASGNGGRHTDSCNCDGYTNSIFTLSISSATQGGSKPWYLEECSSTLATTYSSGTPGHDKSVATVDMDGKLRPDHICTVEHTGTSASAPLAAGICALALEANPNLTWRDMQYLVLLSSRPGPLEKESGWAVNGVKRKVSHKFGYGLMDAATMVNLAEQWTTVPPQHICKSQEINEERKIDPTYGKTLQLHMDVNGCSGTLNEVRFLEHVQCKISLRFFPRGNLRILLTSPMGTTSTLLFERPRDVVASNFDDWPFLSVHYWGEKAEGRWTLQIVNNGNRHVNQPGILKKWQLIFYGTTTNPIRLRTPSSNPFTFPYHPPAQAYYTSNGFSHFQNFPNVYSGQGSEIKSSVVPLNDKNDKRANELQDNLINGEDEGNIKVLLHNNCDPECDFQGCYGKGPTQCIACKHYRLDNTCVSRCPPRSFPNQGGVCWPCHESCETCAGAGQDSCLTCAPAHLRVTDLAVCIQQCPDGYYENSEQNTCVPCQPNCASCIDRPDFCSSCDHHLVMFENKCYAACPTYSYETEDYNCAPCHSSCETCNGSSETQCITCRSGRFSFSGQCVTTCPSGHYADKKRKECLQCPKGCTTCSSSLCLSCDQDWVLKKGKCLPKGSSKCDSSEYYDGSHCRPCHSTCETCMSGGAEGCLSCPSSLLLQGGKCLQGCLDGTYMEQGQCVPCLHTCKTCVSRLNCTSCEAGLQLQSGECRSACADGYYSDRGVCSKCYLSCKTCSGPRRDHCITCPSGWQLAAGECHPECPEGFFKAKYGCQRCHHFCRTCKGEGPLQCTSCPPHFMLDGGLCMECLGSQYYDTPTQLCKQCHESCHMCSGPGQFSCLACLFPLHLDKQNNQCVPCCNQPDQQNCCHCDKETGECMSASSAGKRRIAASAEPGEFSSHSQSVESFYTLNSVTAVVVVFCACIVVLFGGIFTVLQIRSKSCWNQPEDSGYVKVPLNSLGERTGCVDKIALSGDHSDSEEEQLFVRT